MQDDIEQEELEYSVALKKQLDEGASYYKNGGKMVSAAEAARKVNKIIK